MNSTTAKETEAQAQRAKQDAETLNRQTLEKQMLLEMFACPGWAQIVIPYLQAKEESCMAKILEKETVGQSLEVARCRLIAARELREFAEGKLSAIDAALRERAKRKKQ